ncbi:MAG TPA: hypothetical protein VH331_04640 [Allosphingosinicella sp.]|jgi:hypothetical protein|nr:hypothetical protein [Allosphingosinicella sp.]
MQTRNPVLLLASLGALAALGACNPKPTTVVANDYDPQAAELKNAKPVAAPPMIMASRTYRCDDNSLVYADFYTNNTVSVRTKQDPTSGSTTLTGKDAKGPFTAPGYSISANADHVTYSAPGKKSQTCDTK